MASKKEHGEHLMGLIYDVNGFDVELATFIEDALNNEALTIRPLIRIIEKDDKNKKIIEADVEGFNVEGEYNGF